MIKKTSKIYVNKTEDIPLGGHWAILDNNSVDIPGDERSRSAPGHGYPEHTEYFVSYVAFTDRAEFEEELKRLVKNPVDSAHVRGIYVAGSYAVQHTVGLIPPARWGNSRRVRPVINELNRSIIENE